MNDFISFNKALDLTLSNVPIMETEVLTLDRLTGRILAEPVISTLDNPSLDISLKDGYAVVSDDLERASETNRVTLKVIGNATAGNMPEQHITQGEAVRITTGAPIPDGATAVLSEEFSEHQGDEIVCFNTARLGRNVLRKGTDIRKGEIVAEKGDKLTPASIGLLASAGREKASAYKLPRIAVIATGDEVVAPGNPLPEGKLYASNMVATCSWLSIYGFPFIAEVVNDRKEEIRAAIVKHLPNVDAFITSGGVRGSETDLMPEVLDKLKWKLVYHGIRMGPGKGTGFGLLDNRPFFSLPGGPPSNEAAFLELAQLAQ
jgi:molybdopterin molybdotransferase